MSDNYKFQLNIKFDTGYDSPLLNIVGNDPVEFQQNVEFAMASADKIVDAAIVFQTGYNLKKPKDNPPPTQPQGGWSNSGSRQSEQPAAAAPSGPAPFCRHGEMKYVPAGFSKRTNKSYGAFYACTAQRPDQCDSQQAN